MPTYDYVCGACGHALEIFQSITEAPKRKCPSCGKPKLERRIGAGAGILFKGGGFYQTDYRSESWKAGEKKEQGGGAAPAPETGAKAAETKGDAKASPPKPDAKPAAPKRGKGGPKG